MNIIQGLGNLACHPANMFTNGENWCEEKQSASLGTVLVLGSVCTILVQYGISKISSRFFLRNEDPFEEAAQRAMDLVLRIDDSGNGSIFENVSSGNIAGLKKWYEEGFDLNSTDPQSGKTPLIIAVEKGHYGVARFLLENGALVDARDELGRTALYYACYSRNQNNVELLLGSGADVNAHDRDGKTPAYAAAKKGALTICKLLTQQEGFLIDQQSNTDKTPLQKAAENGHYHCVRYLLECGARTDLPDHRGNLPLHNAIHADQYACARLLLPETENPNTKNKEGDTPLHIAVGQISNRLDCVSLLLEDERVNPNELNEENETPLLLSCAGMTGDFKAAELLLSSPKVEVNKQNPETGQTAAHLALALGMTGKKLLASIIQVKDFDPLIEDHSGKSVFMSAFGSAQVESLFPCFEAKSKDKLEEERVKGLTLVEWAAVYDQIALIELLNKKGIFFTLTDDNRDAVEIGVCRMLSHYWMQRYKASPFLKVRELREIAEKFAKMSESSEARASPSQGDSIAEYMRNAIAQTMERIERRQASIKRGDFSFGIASIFCDIDFINLLGMGELLPHFQEVTQKQFEALPPVFKEVLSHERSVKELEAFWPILKDLLLSVIKTGGFPQRQQVADAQEVREAEEANHELPEDFLRGIGGIREDRQEDM